MKWLILLSLALSRLIRDRSPVVRVSNGRVRGSVSEDGSFYEFLGIPYATTTAESRFQAPRPEPTWDGVYDAVNEHVVCPQLHYNVVFGQEDCLVLNVYTPVDPPERPLPVMVFIHGGAFVFGSGQPSVYGPEFLLKRNIILVTINYRLDILGFLCLRTEEAPGNAGLKDQVAALRWIQKNIGAFNGDPDNVTIFGESAGGASVSYHLLSPMSRGLFHKAVLHSGSSIAPWANNHEPLKMSIDFAEHIGYFTRDPKILHELFSRKSYDQLLREQFPKGRGGLFLNSLIRFNPCVEKRIAGVEAFITDDPYDVLKNGTYNRVPTVIGYNSHEGYYFARRDTEVNLVDFESNLPNNLVFNSEDEMKSVAKNVKLYYFGNSSDARENLTGLVRYNGDPFFTFPAIMETQLLLDRSHGPLFTYKFKYDGFLNIGRAISGYMFWPGASHFDEMFYLFKPRIIDNPLTMFEKKTISRMTTMWTNFAKYGSPSPKNPTPLLPDPWSPTTSANLRVFVIDSTSSSEPLWQDQAMRFWRNIYTNFGSHQKGII